MSGKGWLIGGLCLMTVVVWTVAASQLFLFVCGLWGQIGDPITQATAWWAYAFSPYAADRTIKLMLAVTAVVPAALLSLPIILVIRGRRLQRRLTPSFGGGIRPIELGVTDNHGHASWATQQLALSRFGRSDGCLIGALNRSTEAPLLFDDPSVGPGHCMTIAGPGSHKTMTAISRIWHWQGPRVVFDPSLEIAPIMKQALEGLGCTVAVIGLNSGGLDVLDWIDVQNPEADAHIRSAVDWIYSESAAHSRSDAQQQGRDPFWGQWGRALVTCLMADMLYEPDMSLPKTLATLRMAVAQPENVMQHLLRGIRQNSHSAMARDIAGGLMAMKAEETFSSIYSNAFSATEWLSVGAYADLVSGDALRTADILDSGTVLFVQIPLRTLVTTPALGRAIMGALFNALFHADGDVQDTVLFEIDEARVLGAMKEIMLAHTTARKYKGLIHTIWQSEGQVEGVWGQDGAKELRDCCSWRSYNAIQDGNIAEKLSRDIGEHAVMAWSEGTNTGHQSPQFGWFGSKSTGDNVNQHEIKRRLVKAEEILRAPADEMFVLARDFPHPVRCYSAPYFRYPKVAAWMAANRFARNSAA